MYGFGFFLYDVINRFDKICENAKKPEYVQKYEGVKKSLKSALYGVSWYGEWFKRAFTDNGKVLGSKENEECKIDSIAQSWSAISGAGYLDKAKFAMDSLEKRLIDKNARYY